MERAKLGDVEGFGSGVGYELVPLNMETLQSLEREATRILSELNDIAALDGRVHRGAFARSVQQELSCALCHGMQFQSNFSMIGCGASVIAGLQLHG